MQSTIRIDEESFGFTSINEHQYVTLSSIFEKLKNTGIKLYFNISNIDNKYIYDSFITIEKNDISIELPWIKKKHRRFNFENIIILEEFLFPGENIIYILNEVLSNLNKINFRNIIENLSYFETEDKLEQ